MELGEGAFAVVYLGRLQGSPVAVKVCQQNRGQACHFGDALLLFCHLRALLLSLGGTPNLCLSGACPPAALQVIELLPGMDSHTAWREAALLRDCTHERIVPLYGVAFKVGAACMAFRRSEGLLLVVCIPGGVLPTLLPGPFD